MTDRDEKGHAALYAISRLTKSHRLICHGDIKDYSPDSWRFKETDDGWIEHDYDEAVSALKELDHLIDSIPFADEEKGQS